MITVNENPNPFPSDKVKGNKIVINRYDPNKKRRGCFYEVGQFSELWDSSKSDEDEEKSVSDLDAISYEFID